MELGWGPIQGVQGALWSWESFQTLLKQCAFSCDWSRCSGGITSYLLERKPIQQLALLLLNSEALKSGIQIIHRVHIHLSEVQLPHKTKKEKYPGLNFVRNVTFLYLFHTFFFPCFLPFFHPFIQSLFPEHLPWDMHCPRDKKTKPPVSELLDFSGSEEPEADSTQEKEQKVRRTILGHD